MGKGLGIALLIFAALAIVIPIWGIYLGIITALLGIAVAALKEKALAVAIGVLNILNAVFMTPSLKIASAGEQLANRGATSQMEGVFWLWVGAAAVSLVVALVAGRKKEEQAKSTGAGGD